MSKLKTLDMEKYPYLLVLTSYLKKTKNFKTHIKQKYQNVSLAKYHLYFWKFQILHTTSHC